jgi:hypothetical protein
LAEDAYETNKDGWVSSENYVCSEVQVLECPPKLAIRNRPTVKSVVFKVKECDTLKERYDNSFVPRNAAAMKPGLVRKCWWSLYPRLAVYE